MPYELSDTRQVVERSLFESIRAFTADQGYLANINALSQKDISAINQGTKQITINGFDLRNLYLPGRQFSIAESTGNNGTYTVVSSAYTGGNTIITVVEALPDSTVDGIVSIYLYYDDSNGVANYQAAQEAILAAKGFVIEIFGVGSSRAKYQKKIPRIVIIRNQSLPGTLGGNGDPVYTPVGIDPLAPTSYTKHVTPPQTVDFTYDIHIVTSTAEQNRVAHGLVAVALPQRGYIPLYNDPNTRIFLDFFSYRNIPNPGDNIEEDVYMYKVGDLYETGNNISDESIIPITEITTDIKQGQASAPNSAINFGDDMVIIPD